MQTRQNSMRNISRGRFLFGWLVILAMVTPVFSAEKRDAPPEKLPWKAGVAAVVITPQTNMWMAGYAARTKPAEGKETELFGKALALE